jgi:hypothetical protein
VAARSPEARARARERSRAYYAANRDYFRAYHADPGRRAVENSARRTEEFHAKARAWPSYNAARLVVGPPPPPQLEIDDLTKQAMAIAGLESMPDQAFDAGWRDLVQEAVLALLEGRDPAEAVRAQRSVHRLAQAYVRDERVMAGIAA